MTEFANELGDRVKVQKAPRMTSATGCRMVLLFESQETGLWKFFP